MGRARGAVLAASLALATADSRCEEGPAAADPLPWPAVARLGGDAWKAGAMVDVVEWSGDDTRVTAFAGDSAVDFDAATGRVLHRRPWKDTRYDRDSPMEALSPDGKRRAIVGRNAPLRIRDLASGETADSGRIPTTHNVTWDPEAVLWSPDGSLVAVGGGDGALTVLDGRTAAVLWQREAHENGVEDVEWSPDGSRIATGGDGTFRWATENSGSHDGIVRIYASGDGKEIRTLEGHSRGVEEIAWSPDGSRLLSRSEDGARIWESKGWTLVAELEKAPSGWGVPSARWSADATRIATGNCDGVVRIFDGTTGRLLRSLDAPEGAWEIAWAHRGLRIASGGFGGTIWAHDAGTGALLSRHGGHTAEVKAVAWSPDGGRIATAGEEGAVLLWDGADGRLLGTLRTSPPPGGKGEGRGLHGVAWSPDGTLLAAARADGGVSLWDAESGREFAVLVPPALEEGRSLGPAESPAWSPDGKSLAVGSDDPQARIWDVPGRRLLHVLEADAGAVDCVSWTPDGSTVRAHGRGRAAVLGSSGDVLSWDAPTGRPLASAAGPRLPVLCAAWSPDGTRMATQEQDGMVRTWDAATMRCLRRRDGPPEGGSSVAFSPDGTWFATGCAAGWLVLHDASTCERLLAVKAHRGPVTSLAWSPDGARIATVAGSEAPGVWDLYPAPRSAGPGRDAATLPASGPERGEALGHAWNDLGDPRMAEGLEAEERFASFGGAGAAFVRARLAAAECAARPESDLRSLRALRAMARSGAPEARDLLRTLAAGGADAPLAPAAASCLRAVEARRR